MKKFINLIIAFLLVLAPISASALEGLNDSKMKSITGQAGVSIAIDDVVIYHEEIADVTFRDTDGYVTQNGADPLTHGAGIKIDYPGNTKMLITIDAILNDSVYGIDAIKNEFKNTMDIGIVPSGTAMDPFTGNIEGLTNGISPLTIDIGTCSTLTKGLNYNMAGNNTSDIAGVTIGFPTVEINISHKFDHKSIVLDAPGALNSGKELFRIEKSNENSLLDILENPKMLIFGASKMAILGGKIEIAPH